MNTNDDRIPRIENKIDKLDEHLGRIDVTLAAQHVSLKEHMKRSELLEAQLEPVKAHVQRINGVFILIGAVASLAAVIEGLVALLTYLKG